MVLRPNGGRMIIRTHGHSIAVLFMYHYVIYTQDYYCPHHAEDMITSHLHAGNLRHRMLREQHHRTTPPAPYRSQGRAVAAKAAVFFNGLRVCLRRVASLLRSVGAPLSPLRPSRRCAPASSVPCGRRRRLVASAAGYGEHTTRSNRREQAIACRRKTAFFFG